MEVNRKALFMSLLFSVLSALQILPGRPVVFLVLLNLFFLKSAYAFQITSPADETIVRPGKPVLIRVEPAPGETIRSVLFGFGELKSPPWETEAKVSLKEIGLIDFNVVGFVKDATGNHDAEDFITLNVVPETPLTDLGGGFDGPFLNVGSVEHIDITGVFGDGIIRKLTNFQERITLLDEYGITFTSSDPNIVAVGKLGHIQGLKTGKVVITVKGSGGVQTTIPVESSPSTFANPKAPLNHPPTAMAGPDITVQSGATFILDGSTSSDPDGDVLTYSWKQVKGPIAEMKPSTNPAKASYVAPKVKKPKTLLFTLKVRDQKIGRGTSENADSLPAIVKVTVQP